MTKLDFLLALQEQLSDLPKEDVREHLAFYEEMIDDRVEDGLTQEEAVAAVGSVSEIAEQILNTTGNREPKKRQKMRKAWEITLLVLGSLVWVPLLIAAIAVVLSIVVSLWAIFISLAAGGIAGLVSFVVLTCVGKVASALFLLSGGFVCAGLAIFAFYGAYSVTKGIRLAYKKWTSARKEPKS